MRLAKTILSCICFLAFVNLSSAKKDSSSLQNLSLEQQLDSLDILASYKDQPNQQVLKNRAFVHYQLGNYKKALGDITLIADTSDEPENIALYAKLLSLTGNEKKALEIYSQQLPIKTPEMEMNYGQLLFKQHKFIQAQGAFKAAYSQNKKLPLTAYNLALCKLKLDSFDQAIKWSILELEQNDSCGSCSTLIAQSYLKLGLEKEAKQYASSKNQQKQIQVACIKSFLAENLIRLVLILIISIALIAALAKR